MKTIEETRACAKALTEHDCGPVYGGAMIAHVCACCGKLVAERLTSIRGLELCQLCCAREATYAHLMDMRKALIGHEQPLRAAVAELAATWEREGAKHVAQKLRELLGRVA